MPFMFTSDRTELYYADWGSGKPVVFVHGWALGSDMWEYQMQDLISAGFRCIVYDQRGCGRSDHTSTGYDFDTLAAELDTLLCGLDVWGATLVGFSSGGGVIARYLSTFGASRVARSALISSNTPWLLKSPDNPEGVDRTAVYDPFRIGLRNDRPKLLADCIPAFFGRATNGVSSELAQWVIGLCHKSSPVGMLELYRMSNETDFREDMRAFTMPSLIIHGDADPFAPIQATGRRTADAIPQDRLEMYEGASHGLFLTHRRRLSEDLVNFASS